MWKHLHTKSMRSTVRYRFARSRTKKRQHPLLFYNVFPHPRLQTLLSRRSWANRIFINNVNTPRQYITIQEIKRGRKHFTHQLHQMYCQFHFSATNCWMMELPFAGGLAGEIAVMAMEVVVVLMVMLVINKMLKKNFMKIIKLQFQRE